MNMVAMQEAELGKHSRGGRPRKVGDRYPGGKLKPIDPAQDQLLRFRRLEEQVEAGVNDPRWASVIGKLRMTRVLTESETLAAMKYAEVVGRFERLTGISARSAVSPSYQTGYGSYAGSANQTISEAERRAKRAKKQWARLQKIVPDHRALEILEMVCCDDRMIPEAWNEDLKKILGRMAEEFRFIRRGGAPTRTWRGPDARPTGMAVKQEASE